MGCMLTVSLSTAPVPPTADAAFLALTVVTVAVGTLHSARCTGALSSTTTMASTAVPAATMASATVAAATMASATVATPLLGYRSLHHLVGILLRGQGKAHLAK